MLAAGAPTTDSEMPAKHGAAPGSDPASSRCLGIARGGRPPPGGGVGLRALRRPEALRTTLALALAPANSEAAAAAGQGAAQPRGWGPLPSRCPRVSGTAAPRASSAAGRKGPTHSPPRLAAPARNSPNKVAAAAAGGSARLGFAPRSPPAPG